MPFLFLTKLYLSVLDYFRVHGKLISYPATAKCLSRQKTFDTATVNLELMQVRHGDLSVSEFYFT